MIIDALKSFSSLIIYSSSFYTIICEVLIIIPAHNEEDNLPFTLNSLQQQSSKDFKVVVVNDGSTDSTAEVIRNYTETDSRFETTNLQKSEHEPGSKVVHAFLKTDFRLKLWMNLISSVNLMPILFFRKIIWRK